MIVLCEACRFWHRHEQHEKRPGLGSCTSDDFVYGYGVKAIEPNQCLVEDDEGWGFATGSKFGCIHGRPRTDDALPKS